MSTPAPTPPPGYEFHPVCVAFPRMDPAAFAARKAAYAADPSLATKYPVLLARDEADGGKVKIADGRHAELICRELRITPVYERFDGTPGELIAHVELVNFARRQSTKSQMAASLVKLHRFEHGGGRGNQHSGGKASAAPTRAQVAARHGLSVPMLKWASRVQRKAPALFAFVFAGRLDVKLAAAACALPDAERETIAAAEDPAAAARAAVRAHRAAAEKAARDAKRDEKASRPRRSKGSEKLAGVLDLVFLKKLTARTAGQLSSLPSEVVSEIVAAADPEALALQRLAEHAAATRAKAGAGGTANQSATVTDAGSADAGKTDDDAQDDDAEDERDEDEEQDEDEEDDEAGDGESKPLVILTGRALADAEAAAQDAAKRSPPPPPPGPAADVPVVEVAPGRVAMRSRLRLEALAKALRANAAEFAACLSEPGAVYLREAARHAVATHNLDGWSVPVLDRLAALVADCVPDDLCAGCQGRGVDEYAPGRRCRPCCGNGFVCQRRRDFAFSDEQILPMLDAI